jgi:hypothetical protein
MEENEVKVQGEIFLSLLHRLYGDRFTPDMADNLKAATETVVKTILALRSVRMDQVGDPSLPFAPFRKED